jgi:Divergent InlB B-repeat domain
MPTLFCETAGTGGGGIQGDCGQALHAISDDISISVNTNAGSTFAGWSCVGTSGFSYTSTNASTSFTMPNENVNCTATLNSTAVSAPVDSPAALSLLFLGIIAVAAFQRWRKRV